MKTNIFDILSENLNYSIDHVSFLFVNIKIMIETFKREF